MTTGIEIRCSIQLSYECGPSEIPYSVAFSRDFRRSLGKAEKNGSGSKRIELRPSGRKVPDKSPDSFPSRSLGEVRS